MIDEPVEIAGNRLVWRHIQKERALVQMLEKGFPLKHQTLGDYG